MSNTIDQESMISNIQRVTTLMNTLDVEKLPSDAQELITRLMIFYSHYSDVSKVAEQQVLQDSIEVMGRNMDLMSENINMLQFIMDNGLRDKYEATLKFQKEQAN